MHRLSSILLALALSPALAGLVGAADESARVVGVSDGDTLTVLREQTRVRIRLYGIDAPETGQDYGSRAKELASSLAFGETVEVRVHDTDRYGRTVADIILPDGRWLNREMVGSGMAWWYRKYAPDDRALARLEAEARTAGRGLWSQTDPVPPWSWRKSLATSSTTEVVGNSRSRLYHTPTCRGATSMSAKNRVSFDSVERADAAGYRRAGDCR